MLLFDVGLSRLRKHLRCAFNKIANVSAASAGFVSPEQSLKCTGPIIEENSASISSQVMVTLLAVGSLSCDRLEVLSTTIFPLYFSLASNLAISVLLSQNGYFLVALGCLVAIF